MEAAEEVAAAAGPLARTPSAGAPAHIRRTAAARSRLLWRSIVPTFAGHRRCTVAGTLPLSSVSARQARWAARCVSCCGSCACVGSCASVGFICSHQGHLRAQAQDKARSRSPSANARPSFCPQGAMLASACNPRAKRVFHHARYLGTLPAALFC